MALIRIKYIDPTVEELCGIDQDVPRNRVELTQRTTEDGLPEGVLHWPRKGGNVKGKGKRAKSPKKYRVAILETSPPATSKILTGHSKGHYDKPGESALFLDSLVLDYHLSMVSLWLAFGPNDCTLHLISRFQHYQKGQIREGGTCTQET
jgi:hypothetical protein